MEDANKYSVCFYRYMTESDTVLETYCYKFDYAYDVRG